MVIAIGRINRVLSFCENGFVSQKLRNRYPGTYKVLAPIYWRFRDCKSSDKLTSYNGKAITYDAIGNPLTYDGYTFKWGGGRTLTSITGNSKNINYNYNIDGIRTGKTVDGVNYKYTLEGNKVVHEEITNGSTIDKMVYNYGDSGLVGFTLNGTEYFYIRNSQSDIIGILDSNGTQVVGYTYDTWGKLISITGTLKDSVGVKNPYRYRGYRYDTETGYYYLQSRYYNPEIGRFLNADGLISTGQGVIGSNMFVYCLNNPITKSDLTGFRPIYTQGEETDEMRDASYEAVKKMYINKHNYKVNNWYRPPNIDYKTFYSDVEVLKFSINKPESVFKVLLIGGEVGLAKVYKEYKYFGWHLDTPRIDSTIGLDISWDNFTLSSFGKVSLIEGGASIYIPIPFTNKEFEIGGSVDMFSIGGGVGIYDNKFKIGAHLGYGFDLFLGIK